MELKAYLRIVFKYWWIVLLTFASVVAFTYIFTDRQTPVYRSVSTFVMRPRGSMVIAEDEIVRLVDTLSRRIEINTTYAEVAESRYIKNLTAETLGLKPEERAGISVNGKVIAGTNILEIAVEGPDPVLVRDFAETTSVKTKEYISELYDVFELEPLDPATIASTPIRPQTTLNLILGALIGLVGGVMLAFLYVYLSEDEEEPVTFNIVDYETGAYNQAYLKLRLWQEMSRSAHSNGQFSLALMKCDRLGQTEMASANPTVALRKISGIIRSNLRNEDILGRFDESTFAILLPGVSAEEATILSDELRIKVETAKLDFGSSSYSTYLHVVVGIATYQDFELGLDEFLTQAVHALYIAESATYKAVHLFSAEQPRVYETDNHGTYRKAVARGN